MDSIKNTQDENEGINDHTHTVSKPIDTLLLSGGSVNGFTSIGCLQYMYDKNKLEHVKTYIGTSVGTLISYLLILEYKPMDIMALIVTEKMMENFKKVNLINLLNGQGGFDWKPIDDFLLNLTLIKCEQPMSFKDIYERYGAKFVCTTYNISQQKVEYLSVDTHPDLLCTAGIRMSCNIPLIFSRYCYLGNYYVDGGLVDNFSLGALTDDDVVFGINLSIAVDGPEPTPAVAPTAQLSTESKIESPGATELPSFAKNISAHELVSGSRQCSVLGNDILGNDSNSISSDEAISDALIDEASEQYDDLCKQEGYADLRKHDTTNYVMQTLTAPLTYHIDKNITIYNKKLLERAGEAFILTVPVTKFCMNFNIDTLQQLEMFSYGYQYIKNHCDGV